MTSVLSIIASIFVAFVAIEHILILIIEMFLWTKPTGMNIFKTKIPVTLSDGTPSTVAQLSVVLASNQGLYNGFLAAGLIYGLIQGGLGNLVVSFHFEVFFTSCVVIAGIFGSLTLKTHRIVIIQGFPALIALILVCIANNQ